MQYILAVSIVFRNENFIISQISTLEYELTMRMPIVANYDNARLVVARLYGIGPHSSSHKKKQQCSVILH